MTELLSYSNKKYEEYILQDREIGYWLKRTPYLLIVNSEKIVGRAYIIFEHYYQNFGYINPDSSLAHFKDCPTDIKMFFLVYHIPDLKYNNFLKHDTIVLLEGEELVFPEFFFEDKEGLSLLKILNTNVRYPLSKDINKIIKINYKKPSIKMRKSIEQIKTTPELKYSIDILPLYVLFYYVNLSKKYNNVCFPIEPNVLIHDFGSFYKYFNLLIFIEDEKFTHISYNESFIKHTKEVLRICLSNSKKDFLFIPINLQYTFRSSAHATLLIIDKIKKTIHYFDPWGFTEYDNLVYNLIKKFLQDIFPNYKELGYEYLIPPFYCPYAIFQRLGNKEQKESGDYQGFCQLWVFWTIEQIIANPNLDFRDIILQSQQEILKTHKDLKSFIRKYAKLFEIATDIVVSSINYEKRLSKQNLATITLKKKVKEYVDKNVSGQLKILY